MSRAGLQGWWKRFFKRDVFFPGEPEHLGRAPAEAAFARRALGLKRGERLLDLCCGTGRHSGEFSRAGALVTGVDLTAAYLAQARRLFPEARFLRGDMRRLAFRGEFDAAVNLWTSFGYFLSPADDLKTLRGVARALRPGGRFLIDVINGDFLRRHGRPRNWDRLPDGGYRLEEFSSFEGRDPGHTNTWTILRPGRPRARASFFVRNYDPARLSALLRRAGLSPLRRWGSLEGAPYKGAESMRLVILARKP